MLELSDIHKSYGGVTALRGVTLSLAPGEIAGLLGPNGAGKTTLVSIAAGLRRADSGTATVGGIDVRAHPGRARRLIGLAPQELGIYPVLSVRHNLLFFGELAGLRRAELGRRAGEAGELLGLGPLMGRLAGTLSGGEKRRLHTAVALLHRPPLLLLDEPTAGADPSMRADLLALVRRMAGEGTAVCYSTHYLQEVEDLGASVAILDRGRLIASGAVSELVARHGEAAARPASSLESVFLALTGRSYRDEELEEAVL